MDIVEFIRLELPCPSCGKRYPLSLAQVLLSQDMTHDGCSARAEEECPPDFFARLLDREQILAMRQAWEVLEGQASAVGGLLVIGSAPSSPRAGHVA